MIRCFAILMLIIAAAAAVFTLADTPRQAEPRREDFDIIAKVNIFSKNRSPGSQQAQMDSTDTEEQTPVKRKYILRGIAISNRHKQVFIEDPLNAGVEIYTAGEMIGGFTIKEINTDNVVITDGKDNYEIMIGQFLSPEPSTDLEIKTEAEPSPDSAEPGDMPSGESGEDEGQILRKLMERRQQQLEN
ncbi:hypothetical protein SMSP2_01754 [Limihaloglobus sulfuriphilus]|uniref:Type II secretion system protein GspC N-terminal domain-containing protein n=1 Tax=Limihaloglobus sulfuriphilus TaxID=1851148 RepID=A0A1Q2MFA4_9BACT|nr:hypothetical protein [Limihaloglobus sulfuriphilus]AQQ71381.1 hypothetical protein SMSP2_01754 [Limihaloglobus sulfuriphilus]